MRARTQFCCSVAALFAVVVSTAPLHAQTLPPSAGTATPAPVFRPSDSMILSALQNLSPASAKVLGPFVNGLLSDTTSHMKMAPRRVASRADTARANEVVRSMRRSLEKYTTVSVAERDGYVRFLPWLEDQKVFHYNNTENFRVSATQFDATRPTSLLYRKDDQGRMVLVGAMYTAPAALTPDELDARLPSGIAYWHQHVNFCARSPNSVEAQPGIPDSAAIARTLQIETPEACRAANGIFVPQLFGWMAHVNAFESDAFDAIWGEEGKDHMAMHKHRGNEPAVRRHILRHRRSNGTALGKL